MLLPLLLDPAKILGLNEGDAHVIRNAGGRTIEAVRSLVISQQLLGTREIVIIHHVRHASIYLSLSLSISPSFVRKGNFFVFQRMRKKNQSDFADHTLARVFPTFF